jgi:hypothetical protein
MLTQHTMTCHSLLYGNMDLKDFAAPQAPTNCQSKDTSPSPPKIKRDYAGHGRHRRCHTGLYEAEKVRCSRIDAEYLA